MVLVASVVLASAYSFWSTLYTETMAASGRLGRALVLRQSTSAFGSISCPLSSRSSHLVSGALFPLSLYLAVIVPGVWVLLYSSEIWILREMSISVGAMLGSTVDTCSASVRGFGRISHIFYVATDSDPEAFLLHSV